MLHSLQETKYDFLMLLLFQTTHVKFDPILYGLFYVR